MKLGKTPFLRNVAWLLLAAMLFGMAGCAQGPIIQPEDPTDPTEPPVFIEPEMPKREVLLKNYTVVGEWENSRVTATGEDSSVGPARSQDFNPYTQWNPQALAGYAGDPGIMYELDRAYDLNKFVFTMNDTYYFELYVSADGEDWNLIANITKENANRAFNQGICTLEGLQLQDICFVRFLFTGRSNNSAWLALKEVEFFETGATDVDTSWMIPGTEPPTTEPPTTEPPTTEPPAAKLEITDYQITGTFRNSRVWNDGNPDAGLGPQMSIDGSSSTYWNPCAEDLYAGEPGIIYTLNGWYDLTKIELTFGKPDMSFAVYGSSHGEIYTELARVDAESVGTAYAGNTAVLDLAGKGVRYVKIIFLGRPNNQLWVSLNEVGITGDAVEEPEYVAPPATEPPATEPPATEPPATEPPATEPPATEPPATEPPATEPPATEPPATEPPVEEVKANIITYLITGEFAKSRVWEDGNGDSNTGPQLSHDGKPSTMWNPEVLKDYAGEPGIIYTLNGWYDLTKIELTFNAVTYFTVYGSSDGLTYTELRVVNAGNAGEVYTADSIATVSVDGKSVRYVKIILTGRANNSTWIGFKEIGIYGGSVAEPTPPETEPVDAVSATITAHQITGDFSKSRVYDDGTEDTNVGPQLSHDGDVTTMWNPEVLSKYEGEPGIIYILDRAYDLTSIEVTVGTKKMYFKVYGSSDGDTYTELAAVAKGNSAEIYSDNVASVNVAAKNVRYVKIVLTGREDGGIWATLNEISIFGAVAE